jgi:hypothetical protein
MGYRVHFRSYASAYLIISVVTCFKAYPSLVNLVISFLVLYFNLGLVSNNFELDQATIC